MICVFNPIRKDNSRGIAPAPPHPPTASSQLTALGRCPQLLFYVFFCSCIGTSHIGTSNQSLTQAFGSLGWEAWDLVPTALSEWS